MRIALTAAAALFLAGPASATVIVQNLPAVQSLGDFTPFDINGAQFNAGLGTLSSVTAELTGTVTPIIFRSLGPFPSTRLSTRYFLFSAAAIVPGPNAFNGSLADQLGVVPTVTSGGGTYTGAATPVDLNFSFGNPSEFIGTGTSTLLAEFGFRASTPDLTTNPGGASDLTTFTGNLALTYTYTTVPEPVSLSLLATGLAGLAVAGRLRAKRDT